MVDSSGRATFSSRVGDKSPGDVPPEAGAGDALHASSWPLQVGIPQTWNHVCQAFLTQAYCRTRSEATVSSYRYYLGDFLQSVTDPARVRAGDVQLWAYSPNQHGKAPSPSHILCRITPISGLYKLAKRLELVISNPVDLVPRPRRVPPPIRGFTTAEVIRLRTACRDNRTGRRLRAIIEVGLLTALRKAEFLALTGSAFEWRGSALGQNHKGEHPPHDTASKLAHNTGAWYYHIRTKGGKQVHRLMPPPCVHWINHWLELSGRTLATLRGSDSIWDGYKPSGLQGAFSRLCERARVEGCIHDLRRTAARARYEAGAEPKQLQLFMGHTHLSTTDRYLTSVMADPDEGWEAAAAILKMSTEGG